MKRTICGWREAVWVRVFTMQAWRLSSLHLDLQHSQTKLGIACLCHQPCERQRQEDHSGVPASSRAPGSVRHPVSKEQGGEWRSRTPNLTHHLHKHLQNAHVAQSYTYAHIHTYLHTCVYTCIHTLHITYIFKRQRPSLWGTIKEKN